MRQEDALKNRVWYQCDVVAVSPGVVITLQTTTGFMAVQPHRVNQAAILQAVVKGKELPAVKGRPSSGSAPGYLSSSEDQEKNNDNHKGSNSDVHFLNF